MYEVLQPYAGCFQWLYYLSTPQNYNIILKLQNIFVIFLKKICIFAHWFNFLVLRHKINKKRADFF
jgi:hypothetical protein